MKNTVAKAIEHFKLMDIKPIGVNCKTKKYRRVTWIGNRGNRRSAMKGLCKAVLLACLLALTVALAAGVPMAEDSAKERVPSIELKEGLRISAPACSLFMGQFKVFGYPLHIGWAIVARAIGVIGILFCILWFLRGNEKA